MIKLTDYSPIAASGPASPVLCVALVVAQVLLVEYHPYFMHWSEGWC